MCIVLVFTVYIYIAVQLILQINAYYINIVTVRARVYVLPMELPRTKFFLAIKHKAGNAVLCENLTKMYMYKNVENIHHSEIRYIYPCLNGKKKRVIVEGA